MELENFLLAFSLSALSFLLASAIACFQVNEGFASLMLFANLVKTPLLPPLVFFFFDLDGFLVLLIASGLPSFILSYNLSNNASAFLSSFLKLSVAFFILSSIEFTSLLNLLLSNLLNFAFILQY